MKCICVHLSCIMGNNGSIVVRARPSLFLLFKSVSRECFFKITRCAPTNAFENRWMNLKVFMLVKFLLFLSASPNKDGSWCVLWLWFSLSTKLNELRPQAAGFLLLETENNESVLKRKLSWMAPKAFYLELGLSVALWEIMDPAFSEFIPYLSSFQSSSHRQRCLQNRNTSAKIQFVSISVKFLLFVSSNKDGSQHFFF